MHLYNTWLPPSVAEETKFEINSFAPVMKSSTFDPRWRSIHVTPITLLGHPPNTVL
ncbi:hypothetical protein QJS04_geneDACA007864 [Acorus gramineus]|uniref:Uncharacterized protein n=1 Tax=Acorus gramineus TaxID=55184 RepID=A0AAV9BDX5_ACOGR|nr:hypothetical protein QJS04_geneDACA007864 [Acorus gramineus]